MLTIQAQACGGWRSKGDVDVGRYEQTGAKKTLRVMDAARNLHGRPVRTDHLKTDRRIDYRKSGLLDNLDSEASRDLRPARGVKR